MKEEERKERKRRGEKEREIKKDGNSRRNCRSWWEAEATKFSYVISAAMKLWLWSEAWQEFMGGRHTTLLLWAEMFILKFLITKFAIIWMRHACTMLFLVAIEEFGIARFIKSVHRKSMESEIFNWIMADESWLIRKQMALCDRRKACVDISSSCFSPAKFSL